MTAERHGTIHTFEYLFQLEKNRLLFCGAEGDDKVCIKFVRQYSKEAHLKCASLGFAPALRGFELIPGGWYLVVMDFIDDKYHDLRKSLNIASFETEVQEKVASLHQAGFVHGDIRGVNIMVKKDDSRNHANWFRLGGCNRRSKISDERERRGHQTALRSA